MLRLPQSGGDRVYYRIFFKEEAGTLIGVSGNNKAENEAFIALDGCFEANGISVPRVWCASADRDIYLLQDLGDTSLFAMLHKPEGEAMIEASIRELVRVQTIDRAEWESYAIEAPFNRRQIARDLNYFKYEYLKNSSVVYSEDLLDDDFERLAERLMQTPGEIQGFMYRDFQSRNVMIDKNHPYLIDFQGGRFGPCIYDIVSFLWQAKADFSAEEREKYLNLYADEFCRVRDISRERLLESVPEFVLFRTLQVLGAYGFRGLVQRRAHFIESIPGALANLRQLLLSGAISSYPELERICRELIEDERFKKSAEDSDGRLTVEVVSFSYKRGYPEDLSGNGGGFMFDCRAMHNPGRYAEYKELTGLDKPVIDFLEERGEVQEFLASAYRLVDASVERYLSRGFSRLQVGFGCTGGQHRSVYCAEHLAEHLAEKFPQARIRVIHRERGISKLLKNGEYRNY